MDNISTDANFDEVDAVDNTEMPKQEEKLENKQLANTEKKEATHISLTEAGILKPKDSGEEWRIADLMLKSNALPKQFGNVAQVIMALQFLKQHNLPPMVAIRQTTIINGTLSIWGDLPKALVDRSGLLDSFDEFFFDKEYNKICFSNKNLHVEAWGAVCKVERKGKEEIERVFTLDDAKKAGLIDKNNSVWKYYPKRMLQMRARSLALKDAFPDVLSGISINEYDHDVLTTDLPPEQPFQPSVADEINREYTTDETETSTVPKTFRLG